MQVVLVIFKFFARGGVQRDLERTARTLLERGMAVKVVCAECCDKLPENCEVVTLPASGCSNHRRMKSFEQSLGKYLQANPADVVVGFSRMKYLDFYFAADDCLLERWRNVFLNRILPRRRTFLELEHAAMTSKVIWTLTARQERSYQKFYQVAPERFKRIPPGIDRKYQQLDHSAEYRQKLREKWQIPEENFLLVQAAASFSTKGVDRVLAILDSLPPDLRGRITYIAAGDDKRRDKYARLSSILKLDARFPGGVDALEELYCAADLMIHPARKESAGAVLTEALCCNLPVLTSALCGYAEYITASGSGVVLDEPFCLEHWSLALQKLLNEPEHLAQCRKNSSSLYKNEFWYSRPEVMAGEIIAFAQNKGCSGS